MERRQYRSKRFLKLRNSLSLNCTEHPFCEQQIAETIKSFRPPPQSEKLIVTELALDDWVAQTFGIELGHIPLARPPHLPQDVYDMLRKYYFRFQETKKPISPRSKDFLFPQL